MSILCLYFWQNRLVGNDLFGCICAVHLANQNFRWCLWFALNEGNAIVETVLSLKDKFLSFIHIHNMPLNVRPARMPWDETSAAYLRHLMKLCLTWTTTCLVVLSFFLSRLNFIFLMAQFLNKLNHFVTCDLELSYMLIIPMSCCTGIVNHRVIAVLVYSLSVQ